MGVVFSIIRPCLPPGEFKIIETVTSFAGEIADVGDVELYTINLTHCEIIYYFMPRRIAALAFLSTISSALSTDISVVVSVLPLNRTTPEFGSSGSSMLLNGS